MGRCRSARGLGGPFLLVFGGDLGGGKLGNQRLRLAYPVIPFDAALEDECLIDIGDVLVGKIGDLLVGDDAEAGQPLGELGADTFDARQVLGFALRPLESLEGGVETLGAGIGALEDARRLSAPAAQIVELGSPHFAATYDLDFGDVGGIDREYALDSLAIGNLAHREALVEAGTGPGDHHSLIGLQSDGRSL